MPVDDDEERLVHEVIAEDAARGRGVRDEWAQHVGWHRKEDVWGGGLRGKSDTIKDPRMVTTDSSTQTQTHAKRLVVVLALWGVLWVVIRNWKGKKHRSS